MRKAAFVLLVLLAFGFCLNAQIYRSNQIGQMLSACDRVENEGYFLDKRENGETLYFNGQPIREILSFSENGNDFVVSKSESETITKIYSDSLLMKETVENTDGVCHTIYSYVDGHLVLCSYIPYGKSDASEMVFFLRFAQGEEPFITRRGSGISFEDNGSLFENGRLFTFIGNSVVEGPIEETEEHLVVTLDGVQYFYSHEGLLVSTQTDTEKALYFYENDNLSRIETSTGENLTVDSYENGVRVKSQVFQEGVLQSSTVFESSGKVQTLYDNGRVVAIVYYNADNRTVDRIEYK